MKFIKNSILLLTSLGLFITLISFSPAVVKSNSKDVAVNESSINEGVTVALSKRSKDVTINVSPATAKIREAGPQGPVIGNSGKTITVLKNTKRKFWITEIGYVSRVIELDFECHNSRSCKAKYKALNSIESVQLRPDPVYESTSRSVDVNRNVAIRVLKGRSQEEAWEILQSTILSYFDVLEADDANSGYLRTAWVGNNFANNTTRERIIIKKVGKDPIVFNLKFVVEESGQPGTSYNADNMFKPFDRLPKKYGELINEVMSKLRN